MKILELKNEPQSREKELVESAVADCAKSFNLLKVFYTRIHGAVFNEHCDEVFKQLGNDGVNLTQYLGALHELIDQFEPDSVEAPLKTKASKMGVVKVVE